MGKIRLKNMRIRLGNVPVDELLRKLEDPNLHPDIRECINEILSEGTDE